VTGLGDRSSERVKFVEEKTQGENTAKRTCDFQSRKNYGGSVKIDGVNLPIYTNKQMKSLYPNGGYRTMAEYAPGAQKGFISIFRHDQLALPLTRMGSNNRMIYQRDGFAAIGEGEDSYIAILRNVAWRRLLILTLCVVVITGGLLTVIRPIGDELIPTGINAASVASTLTPEFESGAVDWEGIKVSEPEDAPADGIRIPGYKSITIEANKTEVSVNLQNPEQNNCYFVIRLVLLETGETLYESKMIEPGKGLYNIALAKALEPGTYSAQLQYDPYDTTTLTRLNGAVINLELIAE